MMCFYLVGGTLASALIESVSAGVGALAVGERFGRPRIPATTETGATNCVEQPTPNR